MDKLEDVGPGLGVVHLQVDGLLQRIKALLREGLARLKAMHARGCCLVGHPDYYVKFGFRNLDQLAYAGVPAEYFLALSFDGHYLQGTVVFHEAFGARE